VHARRARVPPSAGRERARRVQGPLHVDHARKRVGRGPGKLNRKPSPVARASVPRWAGDLPPPRSSCASRGSDEPAGRRPRFELAVASCHRRRRPRSWRGPACMRLRPPTLLSPRPRRDTDRVSGPAPCCNAASASDARSPRTVGTPTRRLSRLRLTGRGAGHPVRWIAPRSTMVVAPELHDLAGRRAGAGRPADRVAVDPGCRWYCRGRSRRRPPGRFVQRNSLVKFRTRNPERKQAVLMI